MKRRDKRSGPPEIPADLPPFLSTSAAVGPDFICIGMQKGGTRWLFDQLELHPGFWMPPLKELHYFDGNLDSTKAQKLKNRIARSFRKGGDQIADRDRRPFAEIDLDWLDAFISLCSRPPEIEHYARLFAPKGVRLSGDITPRYSALPRETAMRLRDRFPKAKIVYIARDPVARTWSHFCMWARQLGWTQERAEREFDDFVESENPLALSSPTATIDAWSLSPTDLAGDPGLGLFFFDDLVADPAGLRTRILTFIGADPGLPSGDRPADFNRKDSRPKLLRTDELHARMVAKCADEIRACADRFGGPALGWQQKYGL